MNASRTSGTLGTIAQSNKRRRTKGKRAMASQKPKNPVIAEIDAKLEHLTQRLETTQEQINKLTEQREKLLSVDKLKVGEMVIYTPAKRREQYEARIIAITEEGGKGTWYVLRLNEGTVDETTRKARLAEISVP